MTEEPLPVSVGEKWLDKWNSFKIQRTQFIVTNLVASIAIKASTAALNQSAGMLTDVQQGFAALTVLFIAAVVICVAIYNFGGHLNDVGWTKWLAVLTIVPLVNVIFGLILVFKPSATPPIAAVSA